MDPQEKKRFLDFISPFVSDHKKERIEEVLKDRTRYITIVLEDVFQSQNASAVVRTCDCLGIQDVHIIEQRNSYKTNRDVLRGAGKWVSIHKHKSAQSTKDCFQLLKDQGYKLVGAGPEAKLSIEDLDIVPRQAIVFGTELEGLTEFALQNVDDMVRIPMYGFTESFNLSVSAGILMNNLSTRLRREHTINWTLSSEEKLDLRIEWYLKIVRNPQKLEREFHRLHSKPK